MKRILKWSDFTWSLYNMDDGLVVPIHWVREIEPAVVNILLLTVGQGVNLAWLR